MIDDKSLVKTRTNICLSYASAVPSYSVAMRSRESPGNELGFATDILLSYSRTQSRCC